MRRACEYSPSNLHPTWLRCTINSVVSRKTFQIVVLVCLVAFVLAYPVIESHDQWDPPNPASDSELEFIWLLTLAGAVVLLTRLLIVLHVSFLPDALPGLFLRKLCVEHVLAFSPHLTASPPLPPRICYPYTQ